MVLSVLIPCFNEASTLETIVDRVVEAPVALRKELIIVDDGSGDGSGDVARRLLVKYQGRDGLSIAFRSHAVNRGKGAAIRTALAHASGDIVLIQDADLEYNPGNYPALLQPILDGVTLVVYGRRRWNRRIGRPLHWRFALANWAITRLTNVLLRTRLSDQSTGYKVFAREVADRLVLMSEGFEVCTEITAQVRKLGYGILEVPVDYNPRTVREGKKIRARDGLRIVRTLIAQRIRD